MNSDTQSNPSQSDFNHLNKLNPDQSQQNQPSSSQQKINQNNPEIIPQPSAQNVSQSTKTMPVPLNLIKAQIPIQKKQLTLIKESKPRLIIDYMVLKNFKSYAGVQKIGPFHKNFTSIVGPNGSGKSNLIQSMLFIFGFSASWMRLKNLNQLIHNSHSATNVSGAAVQVHFKKVLDNHDGTVSQIPGSQFFIRRTVNTNSVSKYYLNGNDSTQLEIKTKLKSEGIDLTNNRFLILQGEVQQISQMKQKSGDKDKPGFLQYLEEIIGSNQFIQRIEKAVTQYEQAEQQRHQKGERMKIVEEEVKGMSSQKQEAIKYVKKQRKIFQIQTILQQVIRSNNNQQLKEVQSKIAQLQRRKDLIIKQQRQKMAKQQERIMQIRKIKAQTQKYQKQIARDGQKISQLSAQDKNLKNQIAYNSQDQVKYERRLQQINKQSNKIIDQCDQIKKTLPQKQRKLQKERKQLQDLKAQLAKHDKPELRQKIKFFQNQIKKLNHTKNTFNDKKKVSTSEIQKIEQSKGGHQQKKQQFAKLLQQNLKIKATVQLAIQVAQKQYKSKRMLYENQMNQRNKIKNQLQSNQMILRQKNSQMMQQGQFNNMFNHIMKANIPGVVGRLGDLGQIPKQFDDIITTACSRLDNIVTQNYEAARKVLDLLKISKLGRATCIILDKIQNFRHFMNSKFQCPPGAVRLFDLIKPASEQARLAFYFALSNTLYCQNIDRAANLSMGDQRNRRRVIGRKDARSFAIYQMNGSINTMTAKRGGFQRKAAKKTGQNQDKQIILRVQNLSRLLNQKNEKCQNIQRALRTQTQNLQQMKNQKIISDGKVKDVTQELRDIQKMIQRNKGKKQQQQKMIRQVRGLSGQIQKIQKDIIKNQEGLQEVQNQQKKYQTQQITQKRQKFKQLRQQFAKLQKEVQKQENLISTVQKRIKQNQNKKQTTRKNIQKLQNLIQKCQHDVKKIQDIGLSLSMNIASNSKLVTQLKAKQDQIKRSLNADGEGIQESKRRIQQAKNNVQNAKKQIRNFQQNYNFANSELLRIRKLYSEMTSTYDFINDIDQIQQMKINLSSGLNSSMLDLTIQNTSLDHSSIQALQALTTGRKSRRNQQSRVFEMGKLQKVNPAVDLSQSQLDQFLLFQEKLRGLLSTEGKQLRNLQGKNLQVISEYKKKFLDYKNKVKEFQEVKQKQANLKKQINQLKDQRFQMFREGFSIINSKLKQVYQLLTNGGDAELQLIDSLDPFSDGVNFSVRPPKKAWKQINKLSGGQKTLSSLSLIFALHYYKPTPLYFMDQIDAALDFKNVSIVGDYIKKRTKDAQFIIISLRNNMFDLADKLVGVYKTFDQTKVINLAAGKLLAKKQIMNEEKKEKQNQNENIPRISQI